MASSSVTSALVKVPCGQYPPLPISIHGSLLQPMREQLSYNKTPKFAYPYTHWTVKSVSSFLQKVNEDCLLILDVISSQVPVDPWSFYSAPSTCSHTSTTSSNGYRYSTILQTWSQQPPTSSTTPLQSSTPEVFHPRWSSLIKNPCCSRNNTRQKNSWRHTVWL